MSAAPAVMPVRPTGDVRRRRAAERDLAWRFHCADEECCSMPSGLEVLASVCLSGGPARGGGATPAKIGLPFTQRQVDAIDRARRIDRILAMLDPRHAAALRAKYDEPEVPEVVRGVLPDAGDAAIAYVTEAVRAGFARAVSAEGSEIAVRDLSRWFEALCVRILERCASPDDELVIDDIRLEIVRLVEAALSAFVAAAARFDAREQRLWVC